MYDRIYEAARPELFFKGPAWRTVTDGDPVAIRPDSPNNTPEPEVGLVLNAAGERVGFLIVNDMSSRAIEGENPLYLPQAKIYDGSCAISPSITPAWEVDDPDGLTIRMCISRGGRTVFEGTASTAQLKRSFDELVANLFHSLSFPGGAVLSTGTCIVPPLDLTATVGDTVTISVSTLGTLSNRVESVEVVASWLRSRRLSQRGGTEEATT